MNIAEEFNNLPMWGKVGAIGGVASIAAFLLLSKPNGQGGRTIDLGSVLGAAPGTFYVGAGTGAGTGGGIGGTSTPPVDPGTPIAGPTGVSPISTPVTTPISSAPYYPSHPIFGPRPSNIQPPIYIPPSVYNPPPVSIWHAPQQTIQPTIAPTSVFSTGQAVGQSTGQIANNLPTIQKVIQGVIAGVAAVRTQPVSIAAISRQPAAPVYQAIPTPMRQSHPATLAFRRANDYTPTAPVTYVPPAPRPPPPPRQAIIGRGRRAG